MSSSHSPSPTVALGEQLARLERTLLDELEDGKTHFKARDLAKQLPENTRQIGQALPYLQTHSTCLTLERWGGSSGGTLWYVTYSEVSREERADE